MPTANRCQIELDDAAMVITREPAASNTPELIPKAAISGVHPVKINNKPSPPDDQNWNYRFDNMVVVSIELNNEDFFKFELQEVTNQPGWTGNLAGQQQCVDDINAWLES